MSSADPILFEPLPMERVWGGRRLESVLGKSLPPGVPVGESWEVVDRPDVQSVVHGGEFAGKTLHELWSAHRAEIFGPAYANHPAARFPLLIKLLDARERLSVQVHPPAAVAAALQGEPKTEMWYFLNCLPGASIYAGLRRGVTRADFEEALERGEVEHTLHHVAVQSGESIFIPSGRVHAIGEGCLIVEVQQNSDTTYRVFDWNRTGLDGQPRALHRPESMNSIDFGDYEPAVTAATADGDGILAACEHFLVENWRISEPRTPLDGNAFAIFAVTSGRVGFGPDIFEVGAFFLVPASTEPWPLRPLDGSAELLRATLPLPRSR